MWAVLEEIMHRMHRKYDIGERNEAGVNVLDFALIRWISVCSGWISDWEYLFLGRKINII